MPATVEPVVMDSRKFLSAINGSAQSRVALFESLVKRLGEKAGASWRLAGLLTISPHNVSLRGPFQNRVSLGPATA
jgi:hypothetical protein